jgi:hypothetical protein
MLRSEAGGVHRFSCGFGGLLLPALSSSARYAWLTEPGLAPSGLFLGIFGR